MGVNRIWLGLAASCPLALALGLPHAPPASSGTGNPSIPASWFVARSSHQQAPEKPKPAPLKVAPRAYFIDHCQRCHGVDGSNLIPGFAEKETVEKLKFDVKRMADGAGEAPLEDKDLDVQTAYMQLASAAKPFIAWTKIDGTTLSGEVSDSATLTAALGDKPLEIKLDDDYRWTVALPSLDDLPKLKITATLEKKSSVLIPAERPYSVLPNPKETDIPKL